MDLAARIKDRPPLTAEQRDEFLQLIADGKTRQEAATEIGSTGTRLKGLLGRDQEFAQAYADALETAGNPENPLSMKIESLERLRMLERMLDEYILRALDSERGKSGSSNRALANLLTLLHDTFKPFLEARTRHIHEGAVGVYALPQLDLDRWTLAEHEEWVTIEARRNELLAKARPVGGPEVHALPMPSAPETVEDAEFRELGDDDEAGGAGVREPVEPKAPLGSAGISLTTPIPES